MTVQRTGTLPQLWQILASHPVVERQLRAYRYCGTPRVVMAALSADGHHGLLVEINARESGVIPEELTGESAGALTAALSAFDPDGCGARRFVHVQCLDHDADQAFDAFCVLLEERARTVPVARALKECSEEFRRLLTGDRAAPSPKAVGLLGELLVLGALVDRDPDLVEAWVGPSGGRHDFRRGATAIEVKTTLRSAAKGRTVHISDIDQLEPPAEGRLFLHLVRLERVMDGDVSVDSLTADIAARLIGDGHASFLRCIDDIDIDDSDRRATYVVRELAAFEVREGFPALTPGHLVGGSLVPGVSRVSYDLALESAASFEVPVGEALAAMGRAS